MEPSELFAFVQTALTEYDAIKTVVEDDAFRAKLALALTAMHDLLSSGTVKFLLAQMQLMGKHFQEEVDKLTHKKPKV